MNSVMDDNRLLTLPSNERIRLLPHMKLIFEIRDLKCDVSKVPLIEVMLGHGSLLLTSSLLPQICHPCHRHPRWNPVCF